MKDKRIETFFERLKDLLLREIENPTLPPEDRKYVRIIPEHALVETLLQMLGYGGKTIYVPAESSKEKEVVKDIIIADYNAGINVFHGNYRQLLKRRLEKLGIKINPGRILSRVRRELKEQRNTT